MALNFVSVISDQETPAVKAQIPTISPSFQSRIPSISVCLQACAHAAHLAQTMLPGVPPGQASSSSVKSLPVALRGPWEVVPYAG